jgi:hypothetical protein
MVRIYGKACWLFVPALPDVFIGGESVQRLEALGEAIGHQEGIEVFLEVPVGLVVRLLHGGLFEGTVQAFHLTIGPGMVGLGQPMVNAILLTEAIQDLGERVYIALAVGELATVIGQHRMDLGGHGGNQVP